MQAATLAGRNGQVTLVGIDDIWNEIKSGADKAADVAKNALQKACAYTSVIPSASPYVGAAQVACAVTGGTAAGMGLLPGQSAGGAMSTLNPGGLLSNLQQQMTAAQQQAALMALTASKPWYKKPLPWVGIGAGVLTLGTVVVLATRHKGGGRRR